MAALSPPQPPAALGSRRWRRPRAGPGAASSQRPGREQRRGREGRHGSALYLTVEIKSPDRGAAGWLVALWQHLGTICTAGAGAGLSSQARYLPQSQPCNCGSVRVSQPHNSINLHVYCSRASLFTINVNADCTRSGNRFALRGGASCTPCAAVYPNLSSKSPDTRPGLSSTTTSRCVVFHSAFPQKRGCSFQQALSCHGHTASSTQRNKCQVCRP